MLPHLNSKVNLHYCHGQGIEEQSPQVSWSTSPQHGRRKGLGWLDVTNSILLCYTLNC